jgi:hypothetical protein
VQRVNIAEAHVGDLHVLAEVRPYPHPEHAFVVCRCAWPLTLQVLGLEPVDQLGDGRRVALGLDLVERIAASVDFTAKLARPGPRRRGAPVRELADGAAAVAPAAGVVIQDEGPRALGRDADGEPPGLAVVADRVAPVRDRDPFDDGVR